MTNEQLLMAKNVVELLAFIMLSYSSVMLTIRSRQQARATERIHTLVNSSSGDLKKANMLLTRQVAEMKATPENIAAADLARLAYEDHEAKQRAVDATAMREGPIRTT